MFLEYSWTTPTVSFPISSNVIDVYHVDVLDTSYSLLRIRVDVLDTSYNLRINETNVLYVSYNLDTDVQDISYNSYIITINDTDASYLNLLEMDIPNVSYIP